ncbi:hypothetical protein F4805DRAFT_95760 [Annulohypoxylon moriforme]|nr:hypothetical protein F4805DRAFT_95760 [Annulohypoxylon moriforme]
MEKFHEILIKWIVLTMYYASTVYGESRLVPNTRRFWGNYLGTYVCPCSDMYIGTLSLLHIVYLSLFHSSSTPKTRPNSA